MVEMVYVVKRTFDYQGEKYHHGMRWYPTGARGDDAIIRLGWVMLTAMPDDEQPKRKERKNAAKNNPA